MMDLNLWTRLSHRPLMVGMLHNLAGSAALILLVLSTAPSMWMATAYIVAFGLGSMMGMTLVSFAISVPFVLSASIGQPVQMALQGVASLGSIGLGLAMLLGVPLHTSGL